MFSKWKALGFFPISFCQKELCYHEFWAAAKIIVMWNSSFSIEIHVFSKEVANWIRNIVLLWLPNECCFYDAQETSYNKHMSSCLQADFLQDKKIKWFSLAKKCIVVSNKEINFKNISFLQFWNIQKRRIFLSNKKINLKFKSNLPTQKTPPPLYEMTDIPLAYYWCYTI